MNKYFLLLCLLFTLNPLHAEIYKWVDSNGNVTFSDKPHQGAEEVTLPKIQTYSSPKIPALESTTVSTQEPKKHSYKKLAIVAPEDQITIRNPQGALNVELDVKPKLRRGDKVQILLDGTPIGQPEAATSIPIQGIYRGSHTLSAQLIDSKGKTLISSDFITIYMMPPRVGMGGNP